MTIDIVDLEIYQKAEEYIQRLFTTAMGEKAQIINFNLNYVDERFAKVNFSGFISLFNTSSSLTNCSKYSITS